ncbi:nuclear transport factor 2 family protein [Streptomyces daliensis]|uniref:Nuclear transport factor 2 family protein n=1 Tax=Streptomyces daliensis TaxID=299421 RepID=A0A8T4ILN8_9ACTN|nr:nuclear transport factor 2 family protein [Streptomyces daliensis]
MTALPDEISFPGEVALRDEVSILRAEVRALRDRADVAALCDRYVLHTDRDRGGTDWLDDVFTEDAVLTFPFGEFAGRDGLERFQKMTGATFERTHHLSGNYAVELDGDTARVRGHLMAVHVRRREEPGTHYSIGGHYEAGAVRTKDGWRLRTFSFDLTWNAGEGPGKAPDAAS